MTISIPVSYILFPVTLPIALVRLVAASVVAVVIGLGTLITCDNGHDAVFGYARKYTVLEEKYVHGTSGHCGFCRIQKVRVRPGFVPRIAGAKPKIVALWTGQNGNLSGSKFLEDGSAPSARLCEGVKNAVKAQQNQKDRMDRREINLDVIRKTPVEVE